MYMRQVDRPFHKNGRYVPTAMISNNIKPIPHAIAQSISSKISPNTSNIIPILIPFPFFCRYGLRLIEKTLQLVLKMSPLEP